MSMCVGVCWRWWCPQIEWHANDDQSTPTHFVQLHRLGAIRLHAPEPIQIAVRQAERRAVAPALRGGPFELQRRLLVGGLPAESGGEVEG